MHRRPDRLMKFKNLTGQTFCMFGLGVCFFSLAHADVYAFRDAAGHLRWTNAADTQWQSGNEPVEVLVSPTSSTDQDGYPSPAAAPILPSKARAAWPFALAAAQRHGLDPALLMALIEVESSFKGAAVSPKGARGLMQLMPATARRYGLRKIADLHDPAVNVELGARHLRDLLDAHKGNLSMALASYNAGQTAVKRHGGAIPAFRETMLYVPAILARMPIYRPLIPLESLHAF